MCMAIKTMCVNIYDIDFIRAQ